VDAQMRQPPEVCLRIEIAGSRGIDGGGGYLAVMHANVRANGGEGMRANAARRAQGGCGQGRAGRGGPLRLQGQTHVAQAECRCEAAGLRSQRRRRGRITDDPGLAVIVDDRVLHAEIDGHSWWVRLPPAARSVRLRAGTWVPAHTRADETDTRSLGVAISNLRL